MVFDGHGKHSDSSDVGTLTVGNENLDVWSLRDRVRVPPIVILSACDTQAVDRSHATTSNGFLAGGARAVLGTLLPIDAFNAATFVARLLYRIVDYLPAATAELGGIVQWNEVVGGMLRMLLLTDLLRAGFNDLSLTESDYIHIHTEGNIAINTRRSDWLEVVTEMAAKRVQQPPDKILDYFRSRIPMSDAIRYVQLGIRRPF